MIDHRVVAGEAQEDQLYEEMIDRPIGKIPCSLFLGSAIVSILISVSFKIAKKQAEGLFVGQWVAPFLALGIYNKLIKQHGSDATGRNRDLAA